MKVRDFVKMETSGAMFTLVDASKTGYMTRPDLATVTIAGASVVASRCGEWEVVGFEPKTKRNILLYAKEV